MEALNVYPILITWKENNRGMCPIGIAISYAGKRIGIDYLHQSVRKSEWDSKLKQVQPSDPSHELLNQLIKARELKHQKFFLKRQAFDLPISNELIKKYLATGGAIEDFYTYATWLLDNKKLGDDKGYSEESKRRYNDEIVRLKKYRAKLEFRDITVSFLNNYRAWLRNVYKKKDGKQISRNGIWKAFSFIQMVYKHAIDTKVIIIDNSPFNEFKVGTCDEDIDKINFLDIAEVELLEKTLIDKKDDLEEMTYRVGWRFLAMCVLGLRISDAMHLSADYFNDAGDLDFTPYKTRRFANRAKIPVVSDRQKRYLQMTLSLPLPPTDAKNFRTTFNIHLKILGAHAGIKTKLTSHVGRHTMGSFLTDADVQGKAIKQMLGVKRDRTVEIYTHLKEQKLKAEANKLKNIF